MSKANKTAAKPSDASEIIEENKPPVPGQENDHQTNRDQSPPSNNVPASEQESEIGGNADAANSGTPDAEISTADETAGDDAGDKANDKSEDESDEPEIKSNFEKISIRAACPNGDPFRGSYGTLRFDEKGETEVTIADKDSLEDLRAQFPALEIDSVEIKQA